MGKAIEVMQLFFGTEDVGGTNAVTIGKSTTKMIELHSQNVFALFYQAVLASGTVAMTIEAKTHYSDTIASAVEPAGMADIATVANTTLYHQEFVPAVTKWLAITVTGTGSNDADARIKVWLVMQETL